MSTVNYQFATFEGFSPVSVRGPYRAADYWALPEGERVELMQGELVMSPAPKTSHQIIVGDLYALFRTAANRSGGLAIVSPVDVVFSDDTILQPDVLYIAKDRRRIVGDRVNGPPDLVVEVLSEGAERRDRVAKVDLYATHGVAEYWIVDPKARHIEFLLLNEGRYMVTQGVADRYQSPRMPEIEIDLAAFWQEVADRSPQR